MATGKNASKGKAPAKTAKRPPGRPSDFTEAVADAICERLSDGEPLRQICRDDNMPAWRTVYSWMAADKEFSARIAHAREIGEDAIAQDCLNIADDGTNDTYIDGNGNLRTDHDVIARSKLRIDTRLKLLAKWNPKKYGDRVDLNHGGQADNPIRALLQQVSGTALPIVKGNAEE